jgi:hypothetical protein
LYILRHILEIQMIFSRIHSSSYQNIRVRFPKCFLEYFNRVPLNIFSTTIGTFYDDFQILIKGFRWNQNRDLLWFHRNWKRFHLDSDMIS